MPQEKKTPAGKAAVVQEWEKLEKIPAWDLAKVRSKIRGDRWSKDERRKSSSDLIDGRLSFEEGRIGNKAPKIQRSSCSMILDDAAFTEQGSSASQMIAAKVMDIKSRLPGCAGQAAGAVSAYTQVKKEDVSKMLKIPKLECPDIWIRLPRHKWPKSWSSVEHPVVLLERHLHGHLLAGLLWERQFEKILLKHGWEKVSKLGMLIRTPWKRVILMCVCGWHIKLVGKKQNIDPMWKVLNKEVDLGEPTSFLDHVYVACTQRQCEMSSDIVDNNRTMFESRISAVRTEKLPYSENFRISQWSHDMEGHVKKCVERFCEWAIKTTQQFYKVNSMHWWPSFRRRRIEIRGRIVKSMLSNCSEMLVLGTYWKTRYSMVSEQVCTIEHKLDQSLWQMTESIDFRHSSHMWIQTVLLRG